MDSIKVDLTRPIVLKFKIHVSGASKEPEVALQFPFREDIDFSIKGRVEGEYAYITIPVLKDLIDKDTLPAKLVVVIDDVYSEPWRGELVVERQPKAVAALESVQTIFATRSWQECSTFEKAAFVAKYSLPKVSCFVDDKYAKPGRRTLAGWKKLERAFPSLANLPDKFKKCHVIVMRAQSPQNGKWLLSTVDLAKGVAVIRDLGDEWIETAIVRASMQIAYWREKDRVVLSIDDSLVRYAKHLKDLDPLVYSLEDVAVKGCVRLKEGEVGTGFDEWWTH